MISPAGVAAQQPAQQGQTEPGVFLDPNGPAGREYALPFEAARRDVGGGGNGTPGSAEIFGAGVKPTAAGSSAATPGRGSTSGARAGDSGRRGGASDTGREHGSSVLREQGSTPSGASAVSFVRDDASGTLWTVGIATGVLLLGAMAAVFRRRFLGREA
jgi:hypothetical protein